MSTFRLIGYIQKGKNNQTNCAVKFYSSSCTLCLVLYINKTRHLFFLRFPKFWRLRWPRGLISSNYYVSLASQYRCYEFDSPPLPPTRKLRSTTSQLTRIVSFSTDGRWFSSGIPASSANKTDRHEKAQNTNRPNNKPINLRFEDCFHTNVLLGYVFLPYFHAKNNDLKSIKC